MRPITRPQNPYTAEQIIRHVYNHFAIERNPLCFEKRSSGVFCVYNLTGCAVGCLLTEEQSNRLENLYGNLTICDLFEYTAQIADIAQDLDFKNNGKLLKKLQNRHDSAALHGNLDDFIYDIRMIAKEYGVTL